MAKHDPKAAKTVHRDTRTAAGTYLDRGGKSGKQAHLAGRELDPRPVGGVLKEPGRRDRPSSKYSRIEKVVSHDLASPGTAPLKVKCQVAGALHRPSHTAPSEPGMETGLWSDEYSEFFQPYLNRVAGKKP